MEYLFGVSALLIIALISQRIFEMGSSDLTPVSKFIRSFDGRVSIWLTDILTFYNATKKMLRYVFSEIFVPAMYRYAHNAVVDIEYFLSFVRRRLFHRIEKKKPVSLYLKSLEDHKNEIRKNIQAQ